MDKKYAAPAVSKLLDIVEFMSKSGKGYSINELARSVNSPVNSVYRICMEMEERGYIDKAPDTGLYYLGTRFYFLGQSAGSRIDLRTKALPIMRRMSEATGETVHLTILRENKMILLEQVETTESIRIHVETGALMEPYASAFGKCLLAYLPEDTIKHLLKTNARSLTSHTIVDPALLLKELAGIRSDGIAYDREEYMVGVMCVGAPVHGLDSQGIAALGITGPKYRFDETEMQNVSSLVKECARELSICMGHKDSL